MPGIEPDSLRYKRRLTNKQHSRIHQSASLLSVVCIRRKSLHRLGINTAALPSSLTTYCLPLPLLKSIKLFSHSSKVNTSIKPPVGQHMQTVFRTNITNQFQDCHELIDSFTINDSSSPFSEYR